MKTFYSILFLSVIALISESALAQGCVAIRGASSCNSSISINNTLMKGEFIGGTGFRYFKSFRHFRGKEEETNRIEEGTNVINHSSFLDFNLLYGVSNRSYVTFTLPFVINDRSSMYEHGGNPPNGLGERHHTSSSGLADIRTSFGYWLKDPGKVGNGNYAIELGVKLPTGKYDYVDLFYNQGPERDEDRVAVVDQSIQPGDGGFGVTVGFQGYQNIGSKFSLTTLFYYLINPQETNGVLTRNGTSEFSCPDQYAARLGAYYLTPLNGVRLFLGGRIEGVPSNDLIGGSAGYRRPGYVISAEPGLSIGAGRMALDISVPIAVERNRTQSYQDKERTEATGVYRHGDAAFADYLLNVSFSFRFGGKKHIPEPTKLELNGEA